MRYVLMLSAVLFALLPTGRLWAQGLEIEKPLTLTERQEAVKYERLDFNQVPCALLILHLNDDNVDFEGDIRTMQYRNNGEWWLWMINGSNWLTVKSAKYTPLRLDFASMQSGKTYEMTLRPVMTLKLAITEPLRADPFMGDASATKTSRKDANGRTCALLRIGLVLPEAKFVGNGVVHSEYRDGEWWVWLSPDATQMTVTAEGYQALALEFDPVKASTTYVMTLLKEGQGMQRYKWEKVPEGFVDLGLPSSTLWAEENEDALPHRGYLNGDYMNWDEASNFLLPSFEQTKELVNECKWTWNGQGYKVTGPNGNSIELPALGAYIKSWDPEMPVDYRKVGMYWTRVPSGQNYAVVLAFNKDSVAIDEGPRDDGYTVRTIIYPPAEKKAQTDNKVYGSEEIGANPQFIGDLKEWFRNHFNAIGDNDMIGVNFIVESNGKVTDITVLSYSNNEDVETKALGVLKKMPKWKPAMKDGKPVRSVVSMLVDFRSSGNSGNQYGNLPEGTLVIDIKNAGR